MVWLQVSWLIVLFGAEFSYAFEKVDQYEFEPDIKNLSYSQKKLIYLAIARLLTKNFAEENSALSEKQISERIGIPVMFVQHALQEMIEAGIVSDTKSLKDKTPVYQPAKDIQLYTINYIINSLENRGNDLTFIAKTTEIQYLEKSLKKLEQILDQSPANFKIKDI
jgi:membrane protein